MLQLAEFGIVLLIMLIPTFLMGAAFPLANKLYNQNSQMIGRSVGTVYGSNTIGNITGAFIGGFILIPAIGIQNSIFLAVLINTAVGLMFFGMSHELVSKSKWVITTAVAVTVLTVFTIIPSWDISLMSFGPFHEAARITDNTARSQEALKSLAQNSKVIFHKEDLTTTVTVKQVTDDIRTLYINGKPDASSFSDLPTQEMVAHIPLLLHHDPKNTLVIGLASGISLGSAGLHPLEEIDCVEISPAMLEACRYFDEYNYSILDNPRVKTIIADGRNYLELTEKNYDVIISQPSNPYFAGIADLFTREFFELCSKRLTNQGVMCTWVQSYNIDIKTFQSIIRTFHSVFPNMTLWRVGKSDCILIGSQQKLDVDFERLNSQIRSPKIAKDLERINIRTLPEIFSQYVMGSEGIQNFSGKTEIHTDDNALVEFSAPRALTRNAYDWELIEAIEEFRDTDLSFLKASETGMADSTLQIEKAENYAQARGHVFKAHIYVNQENYKQAAEELRKAASLNPQDKMLKEFNSENHKQAFYLARNGQEDQAIALFRKMLELLPIDEKAHYNLATLLKQQGDFRTALFHYKEASRLKPDYVNALYNTGEISERLKDDSEAVRYYQIALNIQPDFIPAMNNLALLLTSDRIPYLRDTSEAIRLAEKACAISNYQDSFSLNTLSLIYESDGRLQESYDTAKKALQLALKDGNRRLAESIEMHLRHLSDIMSEK
jgi:spermidine synthase